MLHLIRDHPLFSAAIIGLSSHFITTILLQIGARLTGSKAGEVKFWKAFWINFIFAFASGIALAILLLPLITMPFLGIIVWAASISILVIPTWGYVLSRFFPLSWARASFVIGMAFVCSMIVCAVMTIGLLYIVFY